MIENTLRVQILQNDNVMRQQFNNRRSFFLPCEAGGKT